MTNEELQQKYRLMQLVAEHGVHSYHAHDGAGHLCMVHYLPGPSPETAQIVALLDALGPRDQTRILERMQVDGAPVVITQLIPGFASLATWLETRTPRPDAGPPAPAASRGAGELTQLFGAAGGEGLDHPAPPSPAPESLPVADPWGSGRGASPSGPPPPGISQGEFTRLFQPEKGLGVPSASALERGSPDFAQAPEASPPPAPAAPPPPAPSQPPGEFTRLMGVGPVGGQPGASAAPGEFTRMIAGAP